MQKIENDFVVCSITEQNGKSPASYNMKSAQEVVTSARAAFNTGKSKSVEFRREQLKKLLCMLEEHKEDFLKVLKQDLGRPRQESIINDLELTGNEIRRILFHLNDWVKPTYPSTTLAFMLDVLKIVPEPYGVVLVLGCWNYPLSLLLEPVAAAISGGNCVVIKPSELASATAELLASLLQKYLDPSCYQVFLGGVDDTKLLLEQKFDYIFFTGSTRVGRIVHAAANKYLTPVTLEMGGKSPVYIDNTADIEYTVRRIIWGKCTNAGQTCIAPDYVLCSEEIQTKFLPIAKAVLKEWYGDDIKSSPNYSRIINEVHYNRLVGYLSDTKNIAIGGEIDASERFIQPTILINVSPNHPVMLEEIFGPILPILIVKNMQEAVSFINAREKPLSIYVFTKEKSVKEFFMSTTSSGSIVVNDTVVQYGINDLPFGGVGLSGMGKYHSKDSFDTFVHRKSVLEKSFNPLVEKAFALRYPPYSEIKTKLLKTTLRTRSGPSGNCLKYILAFCLGVVIIICVQIIYYNVTGKSLI